MTDLATIQTQMKDFWLILPAVLLVPFITYFLGRLGNNTDRILEYRTFLDIDEIRANYKLKNMPNLKSGTKLIIPEEFRSLMKKIEDNNKNGTFNSDNTELLYLKIKAFGKSIITSGTVSIKISSVNTKEIWNLDVSLPILEENEEIFIPIDRLDLSETEIYLKEIKIRYRTQSGEKILYKSIRRKKHNKETVVKDSYSVKKYIFFYRAIDKNNGRNAGWISLDNDK